MSEQSPERKRRLPPIAIVGIILAVLCGISLYIRIALPYANIFVGDWIWFRETDAYWHIRNIEILVKHFPHFNSFDPYILFPGGGIGLNRPFFDWLIAGVILLISRGAPALHTIETVGAYMPAILGTLTLIPAYFIGKELFNRWVGVISAALIAILPGEFLHRSLLGFTDHHVAETLFSTLCVLFLIMAIKRAREREISFKHLLSRDWSTTAKPLIYTLLAGIFLGIYLLNWQGGLLFIFIIFVYLVIQFIVDHLGRKSSDYLCIVGTPLFLIAFLMLLPVLGRGGLDLDTVCRVALPIAIVVPIALSIISRVMASRALKPVYYPLALLALAGIGIAALYAILHAIDPSLFRFMFGLFKVFKPTGAMLTILETTPLLAPFGSFTFSMAWAYFTTSFFLSFVALAMLIRGAIKEKNANKILFLVWSIMMLIAVLVQRRFSYYYAVNVALLTGYFCWKMLDLAGLGKLLAKPKEIVGVAKKFKKGKKAKEKARAKTFMQPRGAWVNVIVVGVIIFFVVFFPNVAPIKYDSVSGKLKSGFATSQLELQLSGFTQYTAKSANYVMDEGWYTSSLWLRENSNTPEPFGDPNFYYELYPPRDEFEYPETAYGVMSWWDYGYFIMQIGHRIPNANPGQQGAKEAGQFFTAQNESSANSLADERGTKYVMIDYKMATPAKFHAMADWAGSDKSNFYDTYYLETADGWRALNLYYPTYYNSMVVRLYNFDGKAATPTEPIVISWVEEESQGEKYKKITWGDYFSSYEDALAYVASQTSGNYEIVGDDLFSSIVPLEALNSYELVYQSGAAINATTVKIFKYLG